MNTRLLLSSLLRVYTIINVHGIAIPPFPIHTLGKMVLGEKCYNDLGCVVLSPEWYNHMSRPCNVFPAERHIVNTNFLIWNFNKNGMKPETISTRCLKNYDIHGPVKLLVHDFTSNGYTQWIETIATAFSTYQVKQSSVISVDWGPGAEPPYVQAVANARLVALEIVKFLKTCQEELGISLNDVHGIGHGLGAHILGYVGKLNRLGRITALDPSGLHFSKMPAQVRLDLDDADFVEVVHTDLTSGGQGILERLGHVDYYINGINEQPGCLHCDVDVTKIQRDDLLPGQFLPACSHRRSVKYYIESLVQPQCVFLGFSCTSFNEFLQGKCSDCGINGSLCAELHPFSDPIKPNSANGFYMVTSSSPPFCVETMKVSLRIEVLDKENRCPYVKGYYNVTIPQPKYGDVNFLLNENGFIKTLRTDREENFIVFRSTPPYLHLPIGSINLYWNPSVYLKFHLINPSSTRVVSLTLFGVRQTKLKFCAKAEDNLPSQSNGKSTSMFVVCHTEKSNKSEPSLLTMSEKTNNTLLNSYILQEGMKNNFKNHFKISHTKKPKL